MQKSMACSVPVSKTGTASTSSRSGVAMKAKCTISSRASLSTRPLAQKFQITTGGARQSLTVVAEDRPTIADSKQLFYTSYNRPIPAMFNGLIQELLCDCHLSRYNVKYRYSGLQALGLTSLFDQVLANYKYGDADAIFNAFVEALEQSPDTFRNDAKSLTEAAAACSSVEDLLAIDSISSMEPALHNKFAAIGMFRCLELAGITDPAALQQMVEGSKMGLPAVQKDLMTYKGLLSKLDSAKQLEIEYLARERKKRDEREAEKAEAAAKKEEAKNEA